MEEAYVSFETAKLLKEKGFNEPIRCWYDNFQDFHEEGMRMSNADCLPPTIMCPTHQMAMAWLREKHRLYIDINIEVGDIQMLPSYDFEEDVLGYSYAIYNEETLIWVFKDKTPRSYEKAVEAAIRYCLENLI